MMFNNVFNGLLFIIDFSFYILPALCLPAVFALRFFIVKHSLSLFLRLQKDKNPNALKH